MATYLLSVHGGVLRFLFVAGVQVVIVGLESSKLHLEVLSLLQRGGVLYGDDMARRGVKHRYRNGRGCTSQQSIKNQILNTIVIL